MRFMLDTILFYLNGINPWAILTILAITPFGEARASIVYGISQGLSPFYVFAASIILNILVVLPLLFMLRQSWVMKIVHQVMGKKLTRLIEKNRKKFEIYEELALFGFVAIPFLGTGAWTGALLSTVLELDVKKSFIVIALGIIAAGIIVSLGTTGAVYLLKG
ncbi:MAG: small multi-drug export protein, partial [Candidatus Aenigmarchaeota archaeon]|nr:small multi-drug export protein [Candidatus Aenigmarchaeota archaeon]